MLSYIGCRPTELVDATKSSTISSDSADYNDDPVNPTETSGTRSNSFNYNNDLNSDDTLVLGRCKALCYKDILLMVVRNPEGGERDVLAMEVTMAHHKGADRRPKP